MNKRHLIRYDDQLFEVILCPPIVVSIVRYQDTSNKKGTMVSMEEVPRQVLYEIEKRKYKK